MMNAAGANIERAPRIISLSMVEHADYKSKLWQRVAQRKDGVVLNDHYTGGAAGSPFECKLVLTRGGTLLAEATTYEMNKKAACQRASKMVRGCCCASSSSSFSSRARARSFLLPFADSRPNERDAVGRDLSAWRPINNPPPFPQRVPAGVSDRCPR